MRLAGDDPCTTEYQRAYGLYSQPSTRSGVEARLAKINVYSDKELLRRSGQHFSVGKAFMKCSWRFLRFYLIKGGFRDGKAGFTYAALNACYKFTTIAKIWERQFLSEK